MAHFTAVQAYDMSGTVVSPATFTDISASEITLDFTGTVLVGHWSGSGFVVQDNDLVGGTLDHLDLGFKAGGIGYTVSGIGKPAASVYDYFLTGDRQAYFGYLLNGADAVSGSSGDDVLRGFTGKDRIHGNYGADTLQGMGGNDVLDGGKGSDALTGGGGADRFYFHAEAGQADRVTDFSRTQHDKIVLPAAQYGVGNTLDAGEFKSATDIDPEGGAANGSAKILYDSDSGRLYYDADGAGTASSPLLLATFGAGSHPALVRGDFVVT